MVEEFTSTPEGMAEFQQERVILEVAILIRKLLKEKKLTKADLAARLGKSKAFVTQLLDGRANMTLRTISDVMCALGQSLRVFSVPLEVRATHLRPFKMTVPHYSAASRLDSADRWTVRELSDYTQVTPRVWISTPSTTAVGTVAFLPTDSPHSSTSPK